MSLLTQIQSLITSIGATVKPLLWLPNQIGAPTTGEFYALKRSALAWSWDKVSLAPNVPSWLPVQPTPVSGNSYAPYWNGTAWSWSIVPEGSPPLSLFTVGWSSYGVNRLPNVLGTGTLHCAVSMGNTTPIIGGKSFVPGPNSATASNVPASPGWTGTNWQIRAESDAPAPSGIGNASTRTSVTVYANMPDPSYGNVSGMASLATFALTRNWYVTISNLTIGRKYYVGFVHCGYPATTTATIIKPTTGDINYFSIDGNDTIFDGGIKRFGFVAAATTMSFQKYGNHTTGSYCNGIFCLDQGV